MPQHVAADCIRPQQALHGNSGRGGGAPHLARDVRPAQARVPPARLMVHGPEPAAAAAAGEEGADEGGVPAAGGDGDAAREAVRRRGGEAAQLGRHHAQPAVAHRRHVVEALHVRPGPAGASVAIATTTADATATTTTVTAAAGGVRSLEAAQGGCRDAAAV